ncbi:MAG: glycosyl hydrolase family 16 [bacterium]|nr:glycosyl hydrolase family 16 [bacterium]
MSTLNQYSFKAVLGATIIAFMVSCERKISDDAVLPTFSTTAEVFTDNFIGLGTDFYFPFADAKPDVFSVDNTQGFQSNSSIRIDVPNATDPTGSYAGAIFRVDGAGRNLTKYDALTFYVKASQGVVLGEVGFGIDYIKDKYKVSTQNVNVGTSWSKVTIPIPMASKLLEERGVFWFAAGSNGTGGAGYTLWFDEIKFEKLGNILPVKSNILGGTTTTVNTFVGSTILLSGLNQLFNLVNGQDITVLGAANYYTFLSSDTSVAKINELGEISVIGTGTAEITGSLGGFASDGKLIIKSSGNLPAAPTPPYAQVDVKSLFSESYIKATEINYAPGFGGSTTQTTLLNTSSGAVLQYTNNNYTGIIFINPIDAAALGFLHIDAYVQNPAATIGIQIRDIGANKILETDVNTGFPIADDKDYRTSLSGFQTGVWKSFDIPLGGNILNQKNNLGALIITGGPDFILDNIYFHK